MHQAFLSRLLPFEAGVPSHDTLNDVINDLDSALFAECFTALVETLRDPAPALSTAPEIVAIDGKTSRRSHARSKDRWSLHMVSARASSQRLVLGQQACEANSHEITAIPLLLERLALSGALVTIDAMGTQTKIARAIIDSRGDYLLALKGNQSSLHDEIRRYLDDPAAKIHSRSETTDDDHGRIEVRRHFVSHDVDWLTSALRYTGLRAIAAVEAEVERNGGTSIERRYYLSFLPIDAKLFAHAVRCHWHVENRLHWALGVVFHEDLSRLRSDAGPQDMATVRHMAMNLLRGPKDKHSLKIRRNQPHGTLPTSTPCSDNRRECRSSDSPVGPSGALALSSDRDIRVGCSQDVERQFP